MKALEARIIASDCIDCRNRLLMDCRDFGLPLPESELILVPARWLFHHCPHMEQGFVLKFDQTNQPAAGYNDQKAAASLRWKGEEEMEVPAWWINLDASKDIGYPVREEGRYGSHPSHDDFDDESQS
jgi:hypothetical protein